MATVTLLEKQERKAKQVSFYISDNLSRALKITKATKGIPFHELMTNALQAYVDGKHQPADNPSEARFLDLCLRYFRAMPETNLELIEQVMIMDLRVYKSSRRRGFPRALASTDQPPTDQPKH